jgi:hypothetical protein
LPADPAAFGHGLRGLWQAGDASVANNVRLRCHGCGHTAQTLLGHTCSSDGLLGHGRLGPPLLACRHLIAQPFAPGDLRQHKELWHLARGHLHLGHELLLGQPFEFILLVEDIHHCIPL